MAVPALRRRRSTACDQRAGPAALPRWGVERRLVRGAQRGSAQDFEALFALHWPRAYRTAWLVVHDAAAAEDIAQEAFIAALRALDSFDRRRPFGPWLSRIVVNRAIDWARAAACRRSRRSRSRRAPPAEGWSEEVVARPALAAGRPARGRGAPPRARLHAGRDRGACSTCRAARSTPACGVRSTGSRPARRRPRWSLNGSTSCCAARRPARTRRASGRGCGSAAGARARCRLRGARAGGSRRSPRRRPRSRSPRRSARRARRSPTGSAPRSACDRTRRPPARARWRAVAIRRAAARLLRRRPLDRRGEREATAARRLDGRLVVAARALRRRLARPAARRGRPARARALVAAGSTAGHGRAVVAERLPRRLPLGPGPARGRGRRQLATACSIPARSGRWSGGPAARTCSPRCRARTSTSSTSTAAAASPASASPMSRTRSRGRADGRRLYVNLHRSLAIYDASGRRTGRIWMPGRQTVSTFAPARSGTLVAVARRRRDRKGERGRADGARARRRGCSSAPTGRFTRLRFSPSGRWLLVAWPLADQWVFLRPGATGARRVLAAAGRDAAPRRVRLPAGQRLVLPA